MRELSKQYRKLDLVRNLDMNDDIRSLPNGDFEVVYKKKDEGWCYCFSDAYLMNPNNPNYVHKFDCPRSNKPNNCPKCIKSDFPYQMPCVCPPKVEYTSEEGIHYINYKNQFVCHKKSKEIYYVKSERNYDPGDSSEPICYCITLENYLYDKKVNSVEYDDVLGKDELELINLTSFDMELLINIKQQIQHSISSTFNYLKKVIQQKEYPNGSDLSNKN